MTPNSEHGRDPIEIVERWLEMDACPTPDGETWDALQAVIRLARARPTSEHGELVEMPSPETLREDAEFVLRNAHSTIAPYAAARIRKAADLIESLSLRMRERTEALEKCRRRFENERDRGDASVGGLLKLIDAALNR